jgi:peptidoglycan hydrolase CwlO-like protein
MLDKESLKAIVNSNIGAPDPELLDYLNSLLVYYNNDITAQNNMITNINQAIDQQQQNIVQLQSQITQCNTAIATDEQDIVYVNELIAIVSAS